MDEIWERAFRPGPWTLIEFIREGAHGNRDGHTLGSEEWKLVFPIQPSRRNRRSRQPIDRDIVENVVSRQALALTVEHTRDEFVTANIVIDHPCRQSNGRILKSIQRLRF